MDSILIILKTKWPKGFICPYSYTGSIFYNIRIYSRSQVSVYRTIGPLVLKLAQRAFPVEVVGHGFVLCLCHTKGIKVGTSGILAWPSALFG